LRSRPFSDKDQANQILLIDIKRVFDEGMVELVTNTLQATSRSGKSASRHRVAKLMRDNDWRAKAARKYKAKKVA